MYTFFSMVKISIIARFPSFSNTIILFPYLFQHSNSSDFLDEFDILFQSFVLSNISQDVVNLLAKFQRLETLLQTGIRKENCGQLMGCVRFSSKYGPSRIKGVQPLIYYRKILIQINNTSGAGKVYLVHFKI